jgi:hypothetical protein
MLRPTPINQSGLVLRILPLQYIVHAPATAQSIYASTDDSKSTSAQMADQAHSGDERAPLFPRSRIRMQTIGTTYKAYQIINAIIHFLPRTISIQVRAMIGTGSCGKTR